MRFEDVKFGDHFGNAAQSCDLCYIAVHLVDEFSSFSSAKPSGYYMLIDRQCVFIYWLL